MKILNLTWEFPPWITGGLGMACYGIVKSLLECGHQVDVILPANRKIYFKFETPDSVDCPWNCVNEIDNNRIKYNPLTLEQLSEIVGSTYSAYYSGLNNCHQGSFFRLAEKAETIKHCVHTFSIGGGMFTDINNYTRMVLEIGSKLDFDVIHAHDWMTYPAAVLLGELSGKSVVCHVHATEFDRAGGPGDGRIHDIEYLGLQCADIVIVVSNYTADIIAEKYLVDRRKIRVVHNAFSSVNGNNHHRRIFKDTTILFLGRITLQKGPDYFLEVARRVLERVKNVHFIMAGSGDMETGILHKSAYHKLGTKFLFSGFLNRDEVETILASTDIFVLPSVSEPFGIAPLEAMSHGAVAIMSKKAGVAEIVQNAYKVDFWDIEKMVSIIVDLVSNPDKRKEMSERGRNEVMALKWNEAGRKISDVYNQLQGVQKCLI